MNKLYYIALSVLILGIFGAIVYVNHKNLATNITQSSDMVPTLPPEANKLEWLNLSPTGGQALGESDIKGTAPTSGVIPTFGVEEGVKASYSATIKTTKGEIGVTLSGTDAPKTVRNFIDKAKSGYYKNLLFHRVEDWVVQGGDPKGNGTGGGLIQTEPNSTPFTVGSLGVARGSDIQVSNDSQFFITKTDSPHLNGQYTNFGIVTEGMDVVNKIEIGDKILGISIN